MNSNNADESDNDHIDTHEQQQLNVAQFIANEFVNDGMEFSVATLSVNIARGS